MAISPTPATAESTQKSNNSSKHGLCGLAGGGIARMVTAPLDVVKIRFQLQHEPISRSSTTSKYNGVVQALKTIAKEEGVRALWRGNLVAELLTMTFSGVQFLTYDRMQRLLSSSKPASTSNPQSRAGKGNSISEHLLGGAVAGCAGTIVSYPLDFVRTRWAGQGMPQVYPTIPSLCSSILKQYGMKGFYRGVGPTLVQIIPYMGIQFASYEALQKLTTPASPADSSIPSSLRNFFCGAISGSFSKIATLPLDTLKKRFQADGMKRHQSYGGRVELTSMNAVSAIRQIAKLEGWTAFYKGATPSMMKSGLTSGIVFLVYEMCTGS